jgi:hypothetical protein
MRYAILAILMSTTPALAQPAVIPPSYAPNFYNRTQQPLSPYLNLLRGGNPAANYYYGVRPGLPSGGANIFGQVPQYQNPVGPQFGGFLPQSQIPYDPTAKAYEPGGQPIRLNSPAHPVLFGNQYPNHGTYFNVFAQNVNRAGYAGGGQPPAQSVQGLGTVNRSRSAAPTTGPRRPPTINAFP